MLEKILKYLNKRINKVTKELNTNYYILSSLQQERFQSELDTLIEVQFYIKKIIKNESREN